MNWVLAGIFGYIVLQLVVGVLASRRNVTESDYLLAGRRLGYGISTFTIFATWFGAETCIGSAGRVYEKGLGGAATDPCGYALCILLVGAFFAVRFWKMGLMTLGDYFRLRFGTGVERLGVVLLVPLSVFWAAAQIRAFGHVIASSSDFSVEAAVVIAAGVVIVYTITGGLWADAVTDVVQGIALIIGLVVLAVVVGGTDAAREAIVSQEAGRLSLWGVSGESVWVTLDDWAIPVLGSLFAQELLVRAMAARSPETARASALTAGVAYLVVGLVPVGLGLVGPRLVPGLDNAEEFLTTLAQTMLPDGLYVLFAGALVSAILSTVDSALLAASALVSHNLIVPMLPGVSERGKVRAARAMVVVFGVVALALAISADGVFELVEEASAFGSAGIVVISLLGLSTPIGGAPSAYAALVTGLGVYIVASRFTQVEAPYLLSVGAAFLAYLAALPIARGSPGGGNHARRAAKPSGTAIPPV